MVDPSTLDLDNLFSPAVLADPFPLYHRLREVEPVRWNPLLGGWLVTRYADVATVMGDLRYSSDWASGHAWARKLADDEQAHLDLIKSYFSRWMQGMDAPDHGRQRGLFNKSFAARQLGPLRARIQELTDRALDAAAPSGRLEVIGELAYPIASAVILELLGVPPDGRELVQASSRTLLEFFAIIDPAPGQLERMAKTLTDVAAYLRTVIAARREAPQNDLLSALVVAEDQGKFLHENELTLGCTVLLFAGHETTTNLIGNSVLALLENPEQLDRLRRGAVPMATAIDELLRYGTPVAGALRVAREDTPLGDKTILKGQRIVPLLAAGNRDPAQFPDPDRLDLGRQDGRSLSFGHGVHYCLGAAIARMEAEIVLGTLLRRFPDLRLASRDLAWNPQVFSRGLQALPVLL